MMIKRTVPHISQAVGAHHRAALWIPDTSTDIHAQTHLCSTNLSLGLKTPEEENIKAKQKLSLEERSVRRGDPVRRAERVRVWEDRLNV